MNLLLDTHIWIWSILTPARLGRRVRRELERAKNEYWLSPVSSWEAILLIDKGAIRIESNVADWITRGIGNFREAPLTHEIALAARQVRLAHHDPADRLLAATARVLDLTLVTADERLLGLGEIKTLANR